MIITLKINAVEVTGRIDHRSVEDISVTILAPYQNLSTGCHIPYFAREIRSYVGEYGDITAKELLNELYELGCDIDARMPALKAALEAADYDALREDVIVATTSFADKKKVLQTAFKQGEITQTAYQNELKGLGNETTSAESHLRECVDKFFEANFTRTVAFELRQQIIEILSKPTHLTLNCC